MKKLLGRVSGCITLAALGLGCGADSVNVGDRPEPIGGGEATGSPDAGGSPVNGSTSCNIADLGQYRLLFDSDGGRLERRIYSMRADGTAIEPLTPPEELAREPALSPDGTQLAYATPEGLRLRDMASGQSELLAPGADQPRWSHDGTRLIYRKAEARCFEQMTMPDRVVRPEETVCNSNWTSLEVTPDGSIVYVSSTPKEGILFDYSLVRYHPVDGGGSELVSSTGVAIAYPRVSPDGIWVAAAYECDGGGVSSLWASPLSVKTPACEGRRITPAGSPSATRPEWGPGLLIAYERGEPPRDLAIIAADTGEECVIPGLGDDRNPSWGVLAPSQPE